MDEYYFCHQNTTCYVRFNSLKSNRQTLLFLHGIGDSSISYLSYISALHEYNVIVPDFLGYGKSSQSKSYRFEAQVNAIIELLADLERASGVLLNHVILIPHSMAGIHAMLLCESSIADKIKAVINVEGSVTQYGAFVSEQVAALSPSQDFNHWFDQFKEETIFNHFIKKFPKCRSYYASLEFAHPRAFLENAIQLHEVCCADSGKYTNWAGDEFVKLQYPKVYCYGKSLAPESVAFLKKNNIEMKFFPDECHFIMQQCFHEFVAFIKDWLAKIG